MITIRNVYFLTTAKLVIKVNIYLVNITNIFIFLLFLLKYIDDHNRGKKSTNL